ncbi:coiled-coil domain-containing protein-domain-containing protein [Chaetomium tenue]|uniref:Coiled-coil domain-containing protein-domain-containing protein n=1 Tax=Chaetomium tenue TaxID=1854479 RepID=A0ACB7P695_9PEZI|nr:coiled-coil domain-containing protein-domain-containing protein [Chaetomium globosum]
MAPRFDSPPSTPLSFSQPRPRPPRSPGRLAQIRVQNRRRAYLEKHSKYFESNEHELADPLLYDSLVRRFQTPSEREAEGREKGYARVLEGSLLRGEERLAKLREQTVERNQDDSISTTTATTATITVIETTAAATTINGTGAPNPTPSPSPFSALTASQTASLIPPPKTRAEGRAQWEEFLRDRFVRGEDADFDYAPVDADDEYDVLEREEREEAWFEDEDPGISRG